MGNAYMNIQMGRSYDNERRYLYQYPKVQCGRSSNMPINPMRLPTILTSPSHAGNKQAGRSRWGNTVQYIPVIQQQHHIGTASTEAFLYTGDRYLYF